MEKLLDKKDFDFNKFIKAFGNKKWRTLSGKIANSYPSINVAIEIACGDSKFESSADSPLFFNSDINDKNAKRSFVYLDESFKYTPIMQVEDTEEWWISFKEYAYLSSNKTEYSFLTYLDIFDSHYDLSAIKVFKNLKNDKLKNINKFILKHYDFRFHLCNCVRFNNNFSWNLNRLKKLFFKASKERNKFLKGFDDLGKKIRKRINLYLINEKKMFRFNYPTRINKNEDFVFIPLKDK